MTQIDLKQKANELRQLVIESLFQAQSGHPGSAMSVMEMLVALYYGGILKYDAKHPEDEGRDYFLLSNGHACPALYAVLADSGYFDRAELNQLRQFKAGAQGHPHRGSLPGIEISSGSLGQGLSVGVGLALALKLAGKQNRVVVMMSDGEQEEGSTWEAVMYASKAGLNNLVAIIDKNGLQIDGPTAQVMPGLDPIVDKYQVFGWSTREVDGHNFTELVPTLAEAIKASGPVVIISHTVRGKGISFMENSEHWHAGAMTEDEYKRALSDLAES